VTRFFLEDTVPLLFVVVLAVVVMGIVWQRLQTPRALRVWIAGSAVGVLLLIVQKLVVTDREAIEQTVRQLAFAVDASGIDGIAPHIDAAYDADTLDKSELMTLIEVTLKRVDVSNARLDQFKIEVAGDTGTASFRAISRLSGRGMEQPVLSFWEIEFARRAEAWRVTTIVPREINKQKVDGLRTAVALR